MPSSHLFCYLKAGHPLAEFLADYPTVSQEQAQQVLAAAVAVLPVHLATTPAQLDFSYTKQSHEPTA